MKHADITYIFIFPFLLLINDHSFPNRAKLHNRKRQQTPRSPLGEVGACNNYTALGNWWQILQLRSWEVCLGVSFLLGLRIFIAMRSSFGWGA